MRKLMASLLVVWLLVAGAATANAAPKHALGWLGTWETTFGRVVFTDVFRSVAPTPDANGHRRYYWALKGDWDYGKHTRRIDGALIERDDYLTMGGCWRPHSDPEACNSILMYRTGEKITHGYWKDCRLGCSGSHHPWKGTRTKAVFGVPFHFTQRGFPDGQRTFRTQTGGAGTVLFDDEKASGTGSTTHESRIFHIDEIPGLSDLKITILAQSGTYDPSAGGRRGVALTMEGLVVRSDNDRCEVGATVGIHLRDGRGGGVPDRIELEGKDGGVPCKIRERWTSSDKSRVNVKIHPPRET